MKRFFSLVLVLGMAVSAFAGTANRKAIQVKYQKAEGTREVAVVVPADVKYQNNYFRSYVPAYINGLNTWLSEQAFLLKTSKTPADQAKRKAYLAEQLAFIQDQDDIAHEDKVTEDSLAQVRNNRECEEAVLAAKKAVEADLKAIRKKVQP